MSGKDILLALSFAISAAFAEQSDRANPGTVQTGATVSFVRIGETGWGLEIAGAAVPRILQSKSARLEVYRTEEDILEPVKGNTGIMTST